MELDEKRRMQFGGLVWSELQCQLKQYSYSFGDPTLLKTISL